MTTLPPIHPGELLREEFLKPHGLTGYQLAKQLGVSAQRVNEILRERRSITADTDLRLCRFFGLSAGYWLRAQALYDTEKAEPEIREALAAIIPLEEMATAAG